MTGIRRGWRVLLAGVISGASVAVAAQPASAAGTFTDDDGNDHEAMIELIAGRDITGGCNPEGTLYCPADSVRRDQMASFIVRALVSEGVEVPSDPPDAFPDDGDSTHHHNINVAAEMAIVFGGDDGQYHPERLVTRGQMALFIQRAFELPPASQDYFTDVPEAYREAANSLSEANITKGCNADGTLYCPGEPVRRDQMASFIGRSLTEGEDAGGGGDTGEPDAEAPAEPGSEPPPPDPSVPPPDEQPDATASASASEYSAASHGRGGSIYCGAQRFWLTGPTFEASPTLYAWQSNVYWYDGTAWQLVAQGPWRYKYGGSTYSWNTDTQQWEEWQAWTTTGGYYTSVDVVYSSATGGQGGDWSYEGGYLATEYLGNDPVGRAPTYYCNT